MDKFKECYPQPAAAPIAILGVPFDNVTTDETLRIIDEMIASRRPHYLATANVDFLTQAAHDVELRRILFDAHLVLCDGTPLVWASKLLGNSLPERVAGSDLVPLLLRVAAAKGYRPFFLGSSPATLEVAVARVKEIHPNLQLAGYYSPPFNKLLEMDHEEIRDRIIRSQPDLLFVGFGCPKQEKWINMHYRSLEVPVAVGVGGTFDFLAGKLARAPGWMQKSGTEWIFRLAQEPKRLFGRYARDFCYFTSAIARQYWRLRSRRPARKRNLTPLHVPQSKAPFTVIPLPARLDFEAVQEIGIEMIAGLNPHQATVLDLRQVEFMDSTGIGLLIRLHKRSRSLGQPLLLASVPDNILRGLELMRLDGFFIILPDLPAVENYLQNNDPCAAVQLRSVPSSPLPALAWEGELTAANAQEYWVSTMDHLAARSLVQRTLTIDLSNLRFIDSTGLSIMIRARKYAARQGMALQFSGVQPDVLNVIRLSRLEEYLLTTKS